jgi:hypothetical protein
MTRSVPPRMRVVAKDVGGGLVVQAGIVGDLAEDAAGSAGGEAAAAIVESSLCSLRSRAQIRAHPS